MTAWSCWRKATLSQKVLSRVSFRGLVDRRALFFVQIECFYSEIHGNCLLNAHCSGHMGEEHPPQHLDVFCLKEVLTGAAPPFPKV